MKILFLGNHFNSIYLYRKELVAELVNRGHEVFISVPKDKKNEYFISKGCTVIDTTLDRKGKNPFSDLRLIKTYKKIIKNIRPNVILSFTIKPNIYGCFASRALGCKQICNITGTGGTFSKKSFLTFIIKFLYKHSVKKSFKVLFQNESDKEFFVSNKIIGKNYDLIPGSGCNLDEFKYAPMVARKKTRLLFIGRIMEIKGIDDFLYCAKKIKDIRNDCEFIIAGNFEDTRYEQIVLDFSKKGIVNYVGYIENRQTIIKDCDCVIVPSRVGEGIANVLLESFSIGRPCIGSNIPGIKEVIEDNKSGFLFERCNKETLVESILKFLNLSFEQKIIMGQVGNNFVRDHFDRKIVINKYLKLIGECK